MKRTSQKNIMILIASIFTTGMFVNIPTVQADPPPWAPAHGHRAKKHKEKHAYRYYYYPEQQVYYSEVKRGYYYIDRGAWLFSPTIPTRIRLGRYVNVDLETPIPYTQHTYIEKTYPVLVIR